MKNKRAGIVDRLAKKYKDQLAHAQKELKAPTERGAGYESDVWLFQKWAYRVGKGWYGFSLGSIPRAWMNVLHEFLEWMETQRPDFEIHQVKLKGRGLRMYLGTKTDFVIPDEDIRLEVFKLEKLLRRPEITETPVRTLRKKRKDSPKP